MTANTPYAKTGADYGRTRDADASRGALVVAVRPDSPAYDAGIEPGMRVLTVAGRPLTDMTVWLWEADDETVELEVFDPSDETVCPCELERMPGEDWGLEFDGAVFDGMRTCVNACVFCFMTMLPKHMRGTLYIRDDDYRLSFLQGNFVTLTNMDDSDVADVIDHCLSPMNVSLHAVTPEVRRRLMGKNAGRGMEVLEQIMAAGIEVHAQIVLCPGINDGEELERTLTYCEEHPAITSLGIVPLGYTRFQHRFTSSYSDDPAAARAVIAQVEPYQERMRAACGRTVFQLADEFYLDAGIEPPAAEHYDGYPQYYDGIGMVRTYLDETRAVQEAEQERLSAVRSELDRRGMRLVVVSGMAARDIIAGFVEAKPLEGRVAGIKNNYFGGNVDVTGLICGEDLLAQLDDDLGGVMLFVPEVMFNADALTLDGYHQKRLVADLTTRGAETHIASTMPTDLLCALEGALGLAAHVHTAKE
ncbi:DUF512 domain-containing protein [Collinsella sp. An2]|uniref:DUF512 domain-containing protein n=1 Tax=Collinsella sp. An2 TaxID=1965585 RepID=UPI000B39433D|nr:DUF512 domain-containing protein [Collinsella sp. An2]OUP08214.1 hypothetical protein B5F33_07280 [Collinsella sp. An2]